MNYLVKAAVAGTLLAGTGAANATLVSATVGDAGNNEMFMSVYDPNHVNADSSLGATYNLDMNVTWNQMNANPVAALASYQGSGYSLSSDANWSAFYNGITNFSAVKYVIAGGSADNQSVILSGLTPIAPIADPTVTPYTEALKIAQHGSFVNAGMVGDSSLIKDQPDDSTGQFNTAGTFGDHGWDGWSNLDPSVAFGTAANLYMSGFHTEQVVDPIFGDTFDQIMFSAADVHLLGQFQLSQNALTFSQVSSVPVPGAVWMFGAGLMGLVNIARRKQAA